MNVCAKIGLSKAQLHQQSGLRWTERKQEVDKKHLPGGVSGGNRRDKARIALLKVIKVHQEYVI